LFCIPVWFSYLLARCHSQASVLAHYLIPCGVEYSLIACAIFYKLFQRIGHDNGQDNEVTDDTGLFVGLLMFMATLVALALFYILYNDHKVQSAVTLYQATNIILLSIGVITVFLALLRFRLLTLRKLSEANAFDDNLLLVGLLGMLFYDMFLLVPAVETRNKIGLTAYLFVAKAVFLILEASRRCARSPAHALNKPGRTLLTFLLVLNLAMWVVNTFELKHAENHQIHKKYYTGIAWKIITHLSLPLLIFFRFHSTVCLADIWSNAYNHEHMFIQQCSKVTVSGYFFEHPQFFGKISLSS
uniref:Otopetrin 3 n=1 Tax=Schistocephalus solidus TaxID=70667 RepID=A0A183SNK6_SCHSO